MHPRLLAAATLLLATPLLAQTPQVPPLSEADTQRLYNLGTGYTSATKSSLPADYKIITLGLVQPDSAVKAHQFACLAAEKTAHLLSADQAATLAPTVISFLRDPDKDTKIYAVRAMDPLAPKLPPNLISRASDESIKLLASQDPEDSHCGALLVETLAPKLTPAQLDASVKAVCDALKNTEPVKGNTPDIDDARARSHGIQIRALAGAAGAVKDPKLAAILIDHLLPAAGNQVAVYSGTHPTIALARLYPIADAKSQPKILAAILDHLADPHLLYSVTSGIRTPLHHAAADALILLAPNLTPADRQLARTRTTEARTTLAKSCEKSDLDNIFPPVTAALDAPAGKSK